MQPLKAKIKKRLDLQDVRPFPSDNLYDIELFLIGYIDDELNALPPNQQEIILEWLRHLLDTEE